MTDGFRTRTQWIEQNLLPHEIKIRAWLSRRRVQDLDVDDIIQEMYARIVSLESVDEIREPLRYAMQVAHSVVASHVRRLKAVTITPQGDLEELGLQSPDASPEDELAIRDEVKEVAEALAALPQQTRDVLVLRRIEGLTQRETAVRLAISEKSVEKHMARAALFLMHHFGRGGKSGVQASFRLTTPAK